MPYPVSRSEAFSAFSMPAANAFSCGASSEPTTAVGMCRGVGLAMVEVYEPANSPAAAATMNTSTMAGRNGDSLKAAHFSARVGRLPWAPCGT